MPVPDGAPAAISPQQARCALRRWRPPFRRQWPPLPTTPRLLPEPLRVRALPLRSLPPGPPRDAVRRLPRQAESKSRPPNPQSIPSRPGRESTLQPRAFLLRAPRRGRLLPILLRRRRARLLLLRFPALRYCPRESGWSESGSSPGNLPRALFPERLALRRGAFLSAARRLPKPRLKRSLAALRKLQPAPHAHVVHGAVPTPQTSARHRESFPQSKPGADVLAQELLLEMMPPAAAGDTSRWTRPEESWADIQAAAHNRSRVQAVPRVLADAEGGTPLHSYCDRVPRVRSLVRRGLLLVPSARPNVRDGAGDREIREAHVHPRPRPSFPGKDPSSRPPQPRSGRVRSPKHGPQSPAAPAQILSADARLPPDGRRGSLRPDPRPAAPDP